MRLPVRFAGRLGRLRGGLEGRVVGGDDRGLLDLGLLQRDVVLVVLVLSGEGGDVVGVEVDERLVGGQPAVARARQRGVGAAPAGGEGWGRRGGGARTAWQRPSRTSSPSSPSPSRSAVA